MPWLNFFICDNPLSFYQFLADSILFPSHNSFLLFSISRQIYIIYPPFRVWPGVSSRLDVPGAPPMWGSIKKIIVRSNGTTHHGSLVEKCGLGLDLTLAFTQWILGVTTWWYLTQSTSSAWSRKAILRLPNPLEKAYNCVSKITLFLNICA